MSTSPELLRNRLRIIDFSAANFYKLFGLSAELSHKEQIGYLFRYLDNGAKVGKQAPCQSIVVEDVYYCDHYRAEFKEHYSTCFQEFPAFARRVHFFKRHSPEDLENILDCALVGGDDEKKNLENSYLGFVVIRPVPAVRVGYTALKYYPHQTTNRQFITTRCKIHLAGIALEVDATPFMQQDQSIAACAATSIWVCTQILPRDAQGKPPSTVEISRRATKYRTRGRPDRAHSGLDIWQMSEAFRQSGLAPELLHSYSASWYKALIRSYVESGLPMIPAMKRFASKETSGHAVAIIGCDVASQKTDWLARDLEHLSVRFPTSDLIYIHDDRLGPYCEAKVFDPSDQPPYSHGEDDPKLVPACIELSWRKGETEKHEKWVVKKTLVPQIPQARLSMLDLYYLNMEFVDFVHRYFKGSESLTPLDLNIYFQNGQTFLRELPNYAEGRIESGKIIPFLKEAALSKYVGVCEVRHEKDLLYALLWDSTDFLRQGGSVLRHLLGVICCQNGIREIMEASLEGTSELLEYQSTGGTAPSIL